MTFRLLVVAACVFFGGCVAPKSQPATRDTARPDGGRDDDVVACPVADGGSADAATIDKSDAAFDGSTAEDGSVPVDECALGLDDCDDAHGACADTAAGFTCSCQAPYEGDGHGPGSCRERAVCSLDNGGCAPLATCTEGVGGPRTCSCPAGYIGDGVGTDGCWESGVCYAPGLCGPGGAACTQSGDTHTCTCKAPAEPTRDARRCARNGWSTQAAAVDVRDLYHPGRDWDVVMQGDGRHLLAYGVVDGTSESRSYVAGEGWITGPERELMNTYTASVKLAMDGSGDTVAIWLARSGDRVNAYTNRHSPDAGWGTESLLETNDAGDALSPRIAAAKNGDAIAVWQQIDAGGFSNIWMSRAAAGAEFGTPALLETKPGHADNPTIAMDDVGNALVAWRQFDDGRWSLVVAHFTPLGGWQEAMRLSESSDRNVEGAQIAFDQNGNAFVVWLGSYDSNKRVRASRLMAATGFEPVQDLGGWNTVGDALTPQVAFDSTGQAIALWGQDGSVWTARYESQWSQASVVATSSDPLRGVRLACSGAGSTFALWYSTTTRSVSRYTPGKGWDELFTQESGVIERAEIVTNDRGDALLVSQNRFSDWTLRADWFEAP